MNADRHICAIVGRCGLRQSAPQHLVAGLALTLAFVLMGAARHQSSLVPIGFHDGDSDVVGETWRCSAFGWAVDPDDVNRDLQVQVLADGVVVATTKANLPRAGLEECPEGSCSFGVPLWGLISANQEHEITVQALDEGTGAWINLSGTPKTLKCMGYPEGWHDGGKGVVSEPWQCHAAGWAVDPERRDEDVWVTIFSDGEMVAEGLASDYRDGLEGVCVGGTCSFSFDLFDRITNGVQHAISAKAHDDETDSMISLYGTPKNLTCLADVSPSARFTVFPENDAVEAWEWPDRATVYLTIDDPATSDTASDYSDSAVVSPTPWGDPRTYARFEFAGAYDLKPGDVVTITYWSVARIHTVQNLSIMGVDPAANTVSGAASPGVAVSVWSHAQSDPPVQVMAGDDGSWLANLTGVFDIVPGSSGRSQVEDDQGNATAVDWNVPIPPSPWMIAFPENEAVEAWEWLENATVYLTIDDPATSDTASDYSDSAVVSPTPWGDPRTYARFEFGGAYDLKTGDVVTITDGVTLRTHVVLNLSVTNVDGLADTVSGMADSGVVDVWPHGADQTATVHAPVEAGAWLADFSVSDLFDLTPGAGGRSRILDAEGNYTAVDWNVPNPRFEVRANIDQVRGWEWAKGENVTLQVGGQSFDELVGEAPWDPSQSYVEFNLYGAYDIQPGDVVVLGNGALTKTTTVTTLGLTAFDVTDDRVSGKAAPGSNVDLWAYDGVGTNFNRHATADASGNWLADFAHSGPLPDEQNTFDLVPGTWVDSRQVDNDGDSTMYGQNVPNPYIEAAPYSDWIHARGWPSGTPVTLKIDGPSNGEGVDYSKDGTMGQAPWNPGDPNDIVADFRWPDQFDPGSGYVLTITGDVFGSSVTKTLIISALAVSLADAVTDTVVGAAGPGSQVHVCANIPNNCVTRWVSADSATGSWTADYSVAGIPPDDAATVDLVPGSNGWASQDDGDGDMTWYDWRVRDPWFTAFPEDEVIEGWDWPMGATVHMTIDDPATVTPIDFARDGTVVPSPWDPNQTWLWIEFWGLYDMKAGDVVTLTESVTTRVHTVQELALTSVSAEENTAAGTAGPVQDVILWSWEDPEGRRVEMTSDSLGAWEGDFDDVAVDLLAGQHVRAEVWEGVNNTAVDWTIPNPIIAVYLEGEFVAGWEWPRGVDIELAIDDPSNGVGVDYSDRTQVEPTPWDPNSWWLDFEFAGVYDVKPGDLVTATDGATVREHVVLPLTVDKISGRADTATGTSFAGANVYIHPWDPDTWWFEPVEADEFGDWSMDFADLYNLVPGLWGVAQVFDEDGDLTAIDWMVPLDIDVRPWSSGNLVACGAAWDLLPVAVLSESGFDATGVDHNSVRFGRTGAEAAVVRIFGRPLRYPRDVNGDGLLDMVYTFRFGDTGFSCTDIPRGQRYTRVEGILTAMMGDVYLEGKDNLTIVRLFIR